MKKNLRTLILTLGILVTTGISSAVYAKDCTATTNYTVNSVESLQKICAKYGVAVPKGLDIKPQVTAPTKATPSKATPTKAVPSKATPSKATPTKTTTTPSLTENNKIRKRSSNIS